MQSETLYGVVQLVLVMMAIVVAAVLTVNIIVELNVFTRFARVGKRLLLALLASCLLAPSVAYSVIATLRERSSINSESLFPILILTSPIIHLADAIRFVVPLSILLFGVEAGLIYSAIAIMRALVRLGIHVLVVRSKYQDILHETLSRMREALTRAERSADKCSIKQRLKAGLMRGLRLLRRILPRLAIAAIVVIVLTGTGLTNYLAAVLDPAFRGLGLTHSMIIVIVAQSIHYMAGMYIAAALFNEGQLTVKQLIIAMLIGAMIRTIMLHFRSYLPVRSAFFTFRVALRWTLLDILTSVFTCILAIFIVTALPIG